ncbi:MAG: single-stranded-DNA-specific exonuclease RecJ [Burkholderiales bacterium]|jgi:single-stranded-DNA-specific exonuclease|nr:single-stranded-DNA-specific exonuclease RecJ [Burkholderiales bacterium]
MNPAKPPLKIKRRFVPAAAVDALTSAGLSPILARVYASRGVTDIAQTRYALSALPHFSQLKNCVETAQRLALAITRHEKIVVVADYDVDGATACAVALRGLREMGATVDFIVPSRFHHGYGISPGIVEEAVSLFSPDILLTVDNGMTGVAAAAEAKSRGIDLIITDHHLPAETLPDTPFIVNPNQKGCPFPSKNLAGVAVMFYVLIALRAQLREAHVPESALPNLARLLDLVALGTVADVVALDHVNRIFVDYGLNLIRKGQVNKGVLALFDVASRSPANAGTFDLGFAIAPRLNAAGRLADMSLGVKCLMAEDVVETRTIAGELDRLNQERKSVGANIEDDALAKVARMTTPMDTQYTLALAEPEWHTGVIGIVASRLKERFNRPTIVFGCSDENTDADDPVLRGSGRSIHGVHLRDALDWVAKRDPSVIEKFGGHAMAAGLTIKSSAFARFAALFEEVVQTLITPEQLLSITETDGAIAPDAITIDLARELRDLVWGQHFPAPLFDDCFLVVSQRILKEKHSKLTLDLNGKKFNAILFGDATPLPPKIRAVFRVDLNEYMGTSSVQLVLSDWDDAQK